MTRRENKKVRALRDPDLFAWNLCSGDPEGFPDGAVEKTRTSTGCPTATSTLRVYQFRHDRKAVSGGGYQTTTHL